MGANWAKPICLNEFQRVTDCEKEEAEPSSTPKKGEYHGKTLPVEKERDKPYLRQSARMIHM